jgi:hypothetical protein
MQTPGDLRPSGRAERCANEAVIQLQRSDGVIRVDGYLGSRYAALLR